MPSLTALTALLSGVATLVLTILGVTDPAIPAAVAQTIPPAAAILLTALAYVHHRTTATAGALSIQAAQVAQAAQAAQVIPAAAPAPFAPMPVSPTVLAQLGAALEAARAGVVATADTGRHEAASPPALPGPAPVGSLSDDTQVIPIVPAVPTTAGVPA